MPPDFPDMLGKPPPQVLGEWVPKGQEAGATPLTSGSCSHCPGRAVQHRGQPEPHEQQLGSWPLVSGVSGWSCPFGTFTGKEGLAQPRRTWSSQVPQIRSTRATLPRAPHRPCQAPCHLAICAPQCFLGPQGAPPAGCSGSSPHPSGCGKGLCVLPQHSFLPDPGPTRVTAHRRIQRVARQR